LIWYYYIVNNSNKLNEGGILGLFDERKKKKLIKEINARRGFMGPLEEDFFAKYDFKVISKLTLQDYVLVSSQLNELLEIINLVGKKLNNVDIFSYDFLQIKKILSAKEDYLYLDFMCSKYDIKIVVEFISDYNIKKIKNVSFDNLDEFIKLNEFKKNNNVDIPKAINSYKEAVNYVNLRNLLLEIGFDEEALYNNYNKFKDMCINCNLDNLNEKNKGNLCEYFKIIFNSSLDIKINNDNDLIEYDFIKQKAIYNYFLSDPNNYIAFFYMLCNYDDCIDMIKIFSECYDLAKINSMGSDNLVTNFGFNNKETELNNLLAQLQNNSGNLTELYKYYRNSGKSFKDIDLFNFRNKLRNVYAHEISSSLTKITKDEKVVLINENDYGIPIYQKEEGDFKFIVHSIINDFGMNESIRNINDKNNMHHYTNPELWDSMSREKGTNALSTSIISSEGTPFLQSELMSNIVIYGFDELDSNSVRNISYTDGATSHSINGFDAYGGGRETMMFSDDLIENALSSSHNYTYNEVAFNRYNSDGTRKKPNFILCFDNVNEASIKHAQYHQVPILIIQTKKYIEDFENRLNKSKEKLAACDKSNIYEYNKCLKEYLKELLRYSRMPSNSNDKKIKVDLNHINEIQLEIDNLEKMIRTNSYSDVNSMLL